ncbi:MAG: 50S ribosome-binding GTPase [Deltaproteobacteria bacterium]|nr:50S ribosome-binding GTPase [Deltaproteobacteria bacterium]
MNMNRLSEQDIRSGVKRLRRDIPLVVEKLQLGDAIDISGWSRIVDKKLLPRLAADFPLVAAICGGGSSGKSTLFNTLIRDHVSPTGGTAGINRRILAAGNIERFKKKGQFQNLLAPLGFQAQLLVEKNDLIKPGNPLYVLKPGIPADLILIDTPDFDTGLKGSYNNRDMARQALEVSDIFIYIFTNANYNNRDNSDFISEMLTHIGQRKCFLVYRVYSSYNDREIIEHAQTVARNLYGASADEYVLGVYRAEEDNRVAADDKFMDLSSMNGEPGSLADALGKLNVSALRMDLVATVYNDVLAAAQGLMLQSKACRDQLRLYRDALQAVQSHCVQEALQHFPMAPVMQRFTEIWFKGDPTHVKFLRKAGGFIELPLKAVVNSAKWLTGKKRPSANAQADLQQFSDQFEEDLLSGVNALWRKSVNQDLSVSLSRKDPVAREMMALVQRTIDPYESPENGLRGVNDRGGNYLTFTVKAHPVVWEAQRRLRTRDWQTALAAIVAHKEIIVKISRHIDSELAQLAEHFRNKMGLMSRIRQTFSAFLTVLPATAAITYILSTGDPGGAAGIKVKLTGLFGLKDLYALVAIPATSGLKKADQKQLEILLIPITRTWLYDKLKTIQMLFEKEISGDILTAANQALDESETLIRSIEGTLAHLKVKNPGPEDQALRCP